MTRRFSQKLEGGINGEQSKQRQVEYAGAFVKRMRETTASYGFTDAQLYLSVFYGWDNSFKTPSYVSSGADGYFMNNYSYPLNSTKLPGCFGSGRRADQRQPAGHLDEHLSQPVSGKTVGD